MCHGRLRPHERRRGLSAPAAAALLPRARCYCLQLLLLLLMPLLLPLQQLLALRAKRHSSAQSLQPLLLLILLPLLAAPRPCSHCTPAAAGHAAALQPLHSCLSSSSSFCCCIAAAAFLPLQQLPGQGFRGRCSFSPS